MFDSFKDKNISVRTIYIYNNPVDDGYLQSLEEFIFNNNSLEIVWIGNNHITDDDDVEMLDCYLIGNMTIKWLYLNENK